jgi:hypothetical protein
MRNDGADKPHAGIITNSHIHFGLLGRGLIPPASGKIMLDFFTDALQSMRVIKRCAN